MKDEKERREISRRSFSIYFLLGGFCFRHFSKQVIQSHVGKEDFALLGVIAITCCKLIHKSDGIHHADLLIQDLQSLFGNFRKQKRVWFHLLKL